MRTRAFAHRNTLEILRDPLTGAFGVGFPLVLLLLLTMIQRNVPANIFDIEQLLPGVAVFGYSFFALFAALLIARDRGSALMLRLKVSPMRAAEFALGYALPLIPMAVLQTAVCAIAAVLLGLEATGRIAWMMLVLLPAAIMDIAIGLICGCLLNERQVGGICGAALTNLSAWLSGAWFDPKLVGGAFDIIAHALPFANAVDAGRAALSGRFAEMISPLLIVCAYAAALTVTAVCVLAHKTRRA